jgi:hypothetical protein
MSTRTPMSFPAMRAVHKIILQNFEGRHRASMVSGFRPLSVQMQGEFPVLYYEVDPSRPTYEVEYSAVITGDKYAAPINSQYVGTAMLHKGAFVLHYFFPTDK